LILRGSKGLEVDLPLNAVMSSAPTRYREVVLTACH